MSLQNAAGTLADYAKDVMSCPVILTSNGKPIAALLSIEEVDLETLSLSRNPEFLSLLEQSRTRHKAEGEISSEEMRRRLGLSPAAQ